VPGAEPVGTLECPEGYILDPGLNLCVPATMTQAGTKLAGKMERCVLSVKENLKKQGKKLNKEDLKSVAIAICRNRLKQ
jgi:hypothetical protein